MRWMIRIKTRDIAMSSRPSAQSAWYWTEPVVAFEKPEVRAEDDRCHERGHGALEDNVPDRLPARAAEGVRTLAVLPRNGSESVDGERRNRGENHHGKHDATREDTRAGSRGVTKDGTHGSVDHRKADEAVDDRGDAHQELDERLEDATPKARLDLHDKDGAAEGYGEREERCQEPNDVTLSGSAP